MRRCSRISVVVAALVTVSALASCGDSDDAASGGATVAVLAGDSSCEVGDTELPAGAVTFEVVNEGSQVTEVYVYGKSGGEYTQVVSEVENIGPGTSRDMDVDLADGTYQIACKPGQTGDGIRQTITVAGDSGQSDNQTDEEWLMTASSS